MDLSCNLATTCIEIKMNQQTINIVNFHLFLLVMLIQCLWFLNSENIRLLFDPNKQFTVKLLNGRNPRAFKKLRPFRNCDQISQSIQSNLRMRLLILKDPDAVADWVAKYVMKKILDYAPTKDRYFVLGLPTGSTPLGVYKKLIEFHKQGKLSFRYVKTFNMDEYIGLPHDHPESYHYYMYHNFFKHIDIDPKNAHMLDGMSENPEAECESFEAQIQEAGGVHLFLGGIGPDGHIAFNEPGSSLVSRTRVKTLAKETIVANARFFNNDLSQVPKSCLTVGVGTVMDAQEVMILVTGTAKAYALHMAIEEGHHKKAIFVVDEDATMELKVKTVRYFKELDDIHRKLNEIDS